MFHLVLGGARSGKSRYAESLAQQSDLPVVYVATAQVYDHEMEDRVRQHKLDRPDHWTTIEEPVDLAQVIRDQRRDDQCVLVDCLTLWMMNLLDNDCLTESVDNLLLAFEETSGPVLMVSNEITMGVVPMGEMSRRFVDELGRLHQTIASRVNDVTLMVAGIPLSVKSNT